MLAMVRVGWEPGLYWVSGPGVLADPDWLLQEVSAACLHCTVRIMGTSINIDNSPENGLTVSSRISGPPISSFANSREERRKINTLSILHLTLSVLTQLNFLSTFSSTMNSNWGWIKIRRDLDSIWWRRSFEVWVTARIKCVRWGGSGMLLTIKWIVWNVYGKPESGGISPGLYLMRFSVLFNNQLIKRNIKRCSLLKYLYPLLCSVRVVWVGKSFLSSLFISYSFQLLTN